MPFLIFQITSTREKVLQVKGGHSFIADWNIRDTSFYLGPE